MQRLVFTIEAMRAVCMFALSNAYAQGTSRQVKLKFGNIMRGVINQLKAFPHKMYV